MTTHKKTFARRAIAGLGIASLGVVGFAAAATADVGPDQPTAPKNGSLTINKYKGNYTENPIDENKLNGVEFIVQQVGTLGEDGKCTAIDLKTNAGWDDVKKFIPTDGSIHTAAPADPYCSISLGDAGTKVTTNGQAKFENLPLGLYFVQEGEDKGNNNIVEKVQPFYVTIPMATSTVTPAPEPEEGEEPGAPTTAYDWNYNVVVNPKNVVSEAPNKQVTDPQPEGEWVLGSEVTWTITNKIPTLNEGTFTEISVTDLLDSRLSYVDGSTVFTLGDETLVESTDGGVTGDYVITDNLVWTLTDAGLEKADAQQGEVLSVVFKTTIESLTENGVVPNEATVSFNNKPQDTPEPKTLWGGFTFVKVDESNPAVTLAGAEFAVTERPVNDEGAPADCPAELTPPVRGTATSSSTGVVSFPGLWVSNWNPPVGDDNPIVTTRDYCLYETKAPAGYEIPAGTFPKIVTVDAEAPKGTVDIGSIKNPQVTPPTLPQTGSNGTLVMTIAGMALVGVGAGTVLVARNRRRDDAA